MKTYTLKLNRGSSYNLYDEETLLSDAELTTLFNDNAGEAYFIFDFNSGTPTSTTQVNIYDSSRNTVVYRNPITGTVAEGRTYKGVWTAGTAPNQFTSFVELKGKTLDEAQLSFLMSKIKEAQAGGIKTLTSADYNWSASGNPPYTRVSFGDALPDGFYQAGEQIDIRKNLYDTTSIMGKGGILIKSQGSLLVKQTIGSTWLYQSSFSNVSAFNLLNIGDVKNNLTTTDGTKVLSAAQGKVLNERIGDLTTLTTTAKTSAVAAINEVNSNAVGTIETLTIADTDWTALSSSSPYTYSATKTLTATIGANSTVSLINDSAVDFATYGFAIGSVDQPNNTVTIYSIGSPDASKNLTINLKG